MILFLTGKEPIALILFLLDIVLTSWLPDCFISTRPKRSDSEKDYLYYDLTKDVKAVLRRGTPSKDGFDKVKYWAPEGLANKRTVNRASGSKREHSLSIFNSSLSNKDAAYWSASSIDEEGENDQGSLAEKSEEGVTSRLKDFEDPSIDKLLSC